MGSVKSRKPSKCADGTGTKTVAVRAMVLLRKQYGLGDHQEGKRLTVGAHLT